MTTTRLAQRTTLTWLVWVFVCICARSATAGGLEIGKTGAEVIGRGGAFIAKGDNAATISGNPAGLAKLRGHHITLSGNVVQSRYDFSRIDPTFDDRLVGGRGANAYPRVRNNTPWFAAPLHFVLTSDFGVFDRLTFALGIYGPPSIGRRTYPDTLSPSEFRESTGAPQRYDFVRLDGLLMFPTVAVAYRLTDWLDIGASFQAVISRVKATTFAIAAGACERDEDPDCDIRVDIDVKDNFSPSGSVGLLFRPFHGWELGSTLRFPSKSTLKGNASLTLGPKIFLIDEATTLPLVSKTTPAATLTLDYPLMFQLGLRRAFYSEGKEVGDIEVDFAFENWAAVGERVVTLDAQSFGEPLAATDLDWKLKNTYAIRVGGHYRFELADEMDLILRGGIWGETATTAVSDTTLNVYGPKRLGVAAGIGFRWGYFQVDFAYQHIFLPTRIVSQSNVRAQQFGGIEGSQGPVVGNGNYHAGVDVMSLQLTATFGRGAESKIRYARQPAIGEQMDYLHDKKEAEAAGHDEDELGTTKQSSEFEVDPYRPIEQRPPENEDSDFEQFEFETPPEDKSPDDSGMMFEPDDISIETGRRCLIRDAAGICQKYAR